MIPRKKRIAITVTSVILAIAVIVAVLIILYLKTDLFKSNQKLFAKYLMQEFDVISDFENIEVTEIKNILENNKYTSDLNGSIEYTENMGTSDENKNSSINKVKLNIASQTDKQNHYYYKDIKLVNDQETPIRLEYLNENDKYGIRLNGIKQFVSIDINDTKQVENELGITNLDSILEEIDYKEIFTLSDEEKNTLKNTYLGLIQSNISKDKYYKQSKALITVNNQDVVTNAYYMKLTKEEWNNLYIKILRQILQDEIILSKVDELDNIIKEKYQYDNSATLRETITNYINNKIKEIENKNIGQDEIRITVYEQKGKTVRINVETTTNKIVLDTYNNGNTIKLDNKIYGEVESEQILTIEKDIDSTNGKISIEYEEIENNEITKDYILKSEQNMTNNTVTKSIQLQISNQKYKTILNIKDDIKIVNQFEEENSLENDNILLNDLQSEQINTILNILKQNIVNQIQSLSETVTLNDYIKMLQNVGVVEKDAIQISDTTTVTDTEKSRFNAQFEFFASENLSADNLKELLEVSKNYFYDMKILTKNGETQDLDVDKMNGNNAESKEYRNNIEEMQIYINKNTTNNEEKQDDVLSFIEKYKSYKFTVEIKYDDETGLAEIIRAKIQEK